MNHDMFFIPTVAIEITDVVTYSDTPLWLYEEKRGCTMIYLTNDTLDQAVYFDLRGSEPRRSGNNSEQLYFGLLGNGVHEVAVTLRSRRGCVEVVFGRSELFSFVEEDALRRMLGELVARKTVH
jgi:hypothetical protein